MTHKRLGLTSIALLTAIVASASPPRGPVVSQLALAAGSSPLMAFGGRSPAQLRRGFGGKLDATLADLASHAAAVRPGHELEDLHSLSPAAHFARSAAGTGPLVSVDAVTRGDPRRLEEALIGLGLQHPAVYRNDVGGWLPVSAIEAAAARGEVASLRAALWHTRAVVATQGDFAQGTAALRGQHPTLTGSGVTVGILSDSYDCYGYYAAHQGQPGIPTPSGPAGYAPFGFTADAATDVSSGALPSGVDVLQEANFNNQGCVDFGFPTFLPFADEGRAMLQIVHAVAPGAKLAFYTASNSEADFANGIHALANAGARVIADDVGYFDEPFFQDGLVAQAIDAVQAAGVTYFSAAGNNSNLAYDDASAATHFTIAGTGAQAGEQLLDFGAGTSALTINVPPLSQGDFIALVVEWDQPYLTGAYPGNPGSTPGASSQIDLCVSSTVTYSIFNLAGTAATCTGANALGTDPVQILVIGNPANAAVQTAAGTVSVSVGLANGTAPPGRIKVAWEDNGAGSTFSNSAQANGATVQGHPSAKGAAAVGAAFFVDTPLCGLVASATLEYFSSFGGTSAGGLPVLFDVNGSRLAQPDNRQKPDFVGPDGTNTTFFGFPIADTNGFYTDNSTVAGCANNPSFPNYFGTSAATPHAAGAAALMLQANPSLTPTQIVGAMQSTAAPMDNPSPDSKTGYGFLQVGTALDALPAGPPMVSVSPTSITAGQSATVTWDGINATSCTGSGSLNTTATNGSMNVMPASAGTYTYTLSCSNANNTAGAVTSSATLTVTARPGGAGGGGGGGGGGALGGVTLLVLASLLLARLVLYPRSVSTSANTKPSRSTTSPTRTAMGAGNIGPADTTV